MKSFTQLQSNNLRWKSEGKLSSYSLQYFTKEGYKNAFASVGLLSSSGSTQSILPVGSFNNRRYRRFACHMKAKDLEMEAKMERKKKKTTTASLL